MASTVATIIMMFPWAATIASIIPTVPFVVLVMMDDMANRAWHPDDMTGPMVAVGPVMSAAHLIQDAEPVVMTAATD